MQVVKFVNIETNLTEDITKKHKIEIIAYDDVYIVIFRKYYSDEAECCQSFSNSYTELEKAQKQFDFYVSLAVN